MRVPLPPQSRVVKRVLPRSLFGRTLLIVLIPLVVVQAVALQVYYGGHLDVVSRRLSGALAGEIAATVDLLDRTPSERDWVLASAQENFDLTARLIPATTLPGGRKPGLVWPFAGGLETALQEKLPYPFTIDWRSDPNAVLIRVQLPQGVLEVDAPAKRLYATTFYLFGMWLLGSSLLVFAIAWLFIRNQVRTLRRLGAAAEAFGMGRDVGMIKPEGAIEVRQAATAFNRMQDRIRRFLQQRTEMLAGVSHDLRTPLTRLRLALAVLPDTPELRNDIAEMTGDIDEMERLIGSYLAFARGEGTEQARPTDLATVLEDVAAGARRAGANVALEAPGELVLPLRADALRRAVTNLVDNACRHARHVALAAMRLGDRFVQVTVDDDGPGIPSERREGVFRSFETGAVGGTGLGLSIARDIVRAHGGEITLEDSPLGGLRARILLPV